MLRSAIDQLLLAWGWRRFAYAAIAGAASALSLAPVHAFPVLWLTFPALVLLLDGAVDPAADKGVRRFRAAFATGYAFGFGYFLAGLWWIGAAFLAGADDLVWLMPIAVIAMPAGLALFTGLGTALARLAWWPGPGRIVTLAITLSLADYARGSILSGFPWNSFGYGLAANSILMQPASLVGLYGMSFLSVLIFAAPATLARGQRSDRAFAAAVGLLLLGLAGFGTARLALATSDTVDGVRLLVMQPNIDQTKKWRPEYRAEIVADYVALTLGPDGKGLDGVTHVIWPESAFPFLLDRDPQALRTIADMLPDRARLITGAIRGEPPGPGETKPHYYNSVHVLNARGEVEATYDKAHLVPFGEYLPMRRLLAWTGIGAFLFPLDDFTAGPGPTTLQAGDAPPVGIDICYEAIFPGAVIDRTSRPGWIVNVTNDGWFGMTAGPWQHLQQVRMRAVEEGIPVVRSANTGISAIIDSYGRLGGSLTLGARGTLISPLPHALPTTPYGSLGLLTYLLLIVTSGSANELINRMRSHHREVDSSTHSPSLSRVATKRAD